MGSLILYIVCTFLGGVGAWLVSRFAFTFGLMDIPNERSSHEIPVPVPKGGGLGILAAFVIGSIALGIPASFWISATALALFSFLGDRIEILPKIRLLVQFIAALALLSPLLFSDSFAVHGLLSSGLSPSVSFLWLFPLSIFIVGTANFYNFMDGINGIGGITGLVGFGLLGFYALISDGDSSFVALPICMSLACLGFLPFNMPRARVFMGDVGSILLGFVFAGMVVWLAKSLLDFVCMVAFVFPFYADELSTMAVRIRDDSGRKGMSPPGATEPDGWMNRIDFRRMSRLARPHRRHIYQLLVNELRVAHWKVSMGYGLLQGVVGAGALMVKGYGLPVLFGSLGICFAGFWGFGVGVRSRVDELVPHGPHAPERFSGAMSEQEKRAPHIGRSHRIYEITGSNIGAEKIKDKPEKVERT